MGGGPNRTEIVTLLDAAEDDGEDRDRPAELVGLGGCLVLQN